MDGCKILIDVELCIQTRYEYTGIVSQVFRKEVQRLSVYKDLIGLKIQPGGMPVSIVALVTLYCDSFCQRDMLH